MRLLGKPPTPMIFVCFQPNCWCFYTKCENLIITNYNNVFCFRPKAYKCKECTYETKYPHNLVTHQSKHLTGEESFIRCDICPEFKTRWELTYRNHMKIKHGVGAQEIFGCTLCEYKTKVKVCLKRHIDRHNRTLLHDAHFKCLFPECHYSCSSKALLKIHILIHKEDGNEPKAFKCTECLYSTNSKTHILKHIKTAHNTGDDTVVCINTKKSNKAIQKKRKPKGKPLYRCVKCSFQTHYHSFLLKHLVKHRGESEDMVTISKVWKCSKCPYATFFQQALEEHQETDCETNNSKLNITEASNVSDSEENNQTEENQENFSNNSDTIISPMEEVNCNSYEEDTLIYNNEEEDVFDYNNDEEIVFDDNNEEENHFLLNEEVKVLNGSSAEGTDFDCQNEENIYDCNNEDLNISDCDDEEVNTFECNMIQEHLVDDNTAADNTVECNEDNDIECNENECKNEENNIGCLDTSVEFNNTEEGTNGFEKDGVDIPVCSINEDSFNVEKKIADCSSDEKNIENCEETIEIFSEDNLGDNFKEIQTNLPKEQL